MEKEQKARKCKKCHKILPEGYKHKYCENCRAKQAEKVKTGIKIAAGTVASAALFVISRGKFGGKKS